MSIELGHAPYSDEDFAPMAKLLGSYFAPDDRLLTREYTNWLYAANPFGRATLVRATEGDRWAAFMAMIPVRLGAACGAAKGYYVVNVLVDPAYQGKHLFGRLIATAKALVADEGSVLLGHPNAAAHPSWKRAKMVFHDDLRPELAIVSPFGPVRARRVATVEELAPAADVMADVVRTSQSWRVAATPEYVHWRYLSHPTNNYVVQLLERDGTVAGVQAVKRLRPGVNLLVDQFVRDEDRVNATRRLPLFTVCFRPKVSGVRTRAAMPLPVRKRIPVFFTPSTGSPANYSITELALSPSDF
jgi:GNAT superfamily N-acetyltransferase